MINHFKASVSKIDEDIERDLKIQCLDQKNFYYGAIANIVNGYTEPNAIIFASKLIGAYYNKFSKWYRNNLLLERAIIAAKHTIKRLNDDGTLDLMETNFHDPTFNGFCMHDVGPAFTLLIRDTQHTVLENEMEACLEEFTRRSGDAIVNGGFHTPNHRWVISAALSYCYNILHDEKYLKHIKKFLDNEGIDCDADGEFSERSAGIYNIVCDKSLIMMSEELGMPELLDHVSRNLRMIMTYFEPDNTINTLNSTRQDFGKDPRFTAYYEPFLKMAILTEDPEFAWMADYMRSQGGDCNMIWFLLHPEYEEKQLSIGTKKPCFNYEKLYTVSGILRQRINDATLTLIKGRPLFAKFQFKNKPVFFRFAGSFFGSQGQFSPQTLEKTDNGYRLTYHRRWGYMGPFDEKQSSPFWNDMDIKKRPSLGMQNYDIIFNFKLTDGELKIDIDACTENGSCDNIPCKFEIMFNAGCVFENDSSAIIAREGDYVFQKDNPCSITYGDHTRFTVEGGFCEHYYAKSMRGSIGADGKAFTVCFTGFTPKKKSIKIKYFNN